MPFHYLMCARNVVSRAFGAEPGDIRFLKVPMERGRLPKPSDEIDPNRWIREVTVLAQRTKGGKTGSDGDVLIWVHGYNNDLPAIMKRQSYLVADLENAGFDGAVVSFDWPSDDSTLNYIEDRSDASAVARHLVTDGVTRLNQLQDAGCKLNVHLLGHSTGAYVILEAFEQAQRDGELYKSPWRVDQIGFIAGDIAATSLDAGPNGAKTMFDRCVRVTNYFNGDDHVLAVSNAKRFGTSPRAGRVGATSNRDGKVANVDCRTWFEQKDPATSTFDGTFAHSWYIGDAVWARDWAMTMNSGLDRRAIPTRSVRANGDLELQDSPRPLHEDAWAAETPRAAKKLAADGQ